MPARARPSNQRRASSTSARRNKGVPPTTVALRAARRRSSRPAAVARRLRVAAEERFEAAGNRFNGRERIVHFVAEHPNESLPRHPFFFAQGAAKIGQNEQLVRQTVFAELTFAHAPTTRPARETQAQGRVFVGVEANGKAKIGCAPAEQLVDRLT